MPATIVADRSATASQSTAVADRPRSYRPAKGLAGLLSRPAIAVRSTKCIDRTMLGCVAWAVSSLLASLATAQSLISFERQQLTDTYYSEGISVGDINADGTNDIVYGPYWFAGPEFTSRHEIYPAVPQPVERYADHFFSWIYDFDGDGANDVFVVGFPGTPAYVYRNPGAGVGNWEKHEVFDWVSNESPQLADLVGDERPELVCTRDGFFGYASIDWSKPLSPWQFHPVSEKVTATKFGHGLGIGDINGDGRKDILHAQGWYEQPASGAGDRRWREHAVSFSSAYGGAEMYAYDVDGDGDQDVITSEAAHDFGLAWYEQTQADDQLNFLRHEIMGREPADNAYGVVFSELHSLALADIDGDGLQDIVTGKTYWSHHKQSPMWDAGAVAYFFQLVRGPDGIDWIPHQIHGETGIGRQLTVADIDQDGLLDVATGGMLGANVLLQQRRQVSSAEYRAAQPKLYDGPRPAPTPAAITLRGPRIPLGPDGKLSDAIEGESLSAQATGGTARAQSMQNFSAGLWSGNSQLWWTGAKPGDSLTIQLDAMRDVESLHMALTYARDYGIVEIRLDDQPLGPPIDLFNNQVISSGLLSFKTPGLKRGKHELSFVIRGANPSAVKAYMFGLDFIQFHGAGDAQSATADEIKPVAADGREINVDFESGTLADWTSEGEAFEGQPIQGDSVAARGRGMNSRHWGDYWIGGYEKVGDRPVGTLTSVPFRATARFASFYVGGGSSHATRVELWRVGEDEPFYTVSGKNVEDLQPVVVDLRRVQDSEMFIRLVDESRGGWGHINFDHFRFHTERPGELTPPSVDLVDDEYPYGGLSAEEAAAAMQLPDGFEVSVLAAEPDVKQPIAMALDDRGRVWIAEAYEYPQRAEGDTGRDRILIFEDTTGDGRLDSRKVFQEGLNLVSGLEIGFGGVWVGAAPYLLFIPDRNADDKPDSEPQVLLDGWGFQDTHETLNAFCWGPDGWLYGCHGVFTHSRVGKPGTPPAERTPINAGIWRYHPVQHEFEVFAHGTSNPWGVDFDAHGEAFATACVIPHLYHIIPGGRYQRQAGEHFNPHTYDDIKTIADHLHYLGATPHSGNGKSDEAGGGHAHAGAMIYQGGAWPAQYAGALFMNNIHGQRLNVDLLEDSGSGYVGHHGDDFLLTGDLASQILNMRYGPDGQVIFIDWYDMQACHRREVEVHDRSNGRIYKVSYGQSKSTPVDLAGFSDLQLAESCLHENDWYVRHSRRLLQERATQRKIDRDAIDRLVEIFTTHPDDTRRLRAVWARRAIGTLGWEIYDRLLKDGSPHVRGWAVRLLAQQQEGPLAQQQLEWLTNMAEQDDSAIVRRALSSAVDRLPVADRWTIVAALVKHTEDASDHNLPLLYWYIMKPLAEADPDRALALGIAAGESIPQLREFMLRRVAGSGGEDAIARMVNALGQATRGDLQLTFLQAIRAALSGQRQATPPPGWQATYGQLSNSSQADVRLQAAAVGSVFGTEEAASYLRQTLADRDADSAARLDALSALLAARDPGLVGTLLDVVADRSRPANEVEAAIRGLAQYDAPEIPPALIGLYSQLEETQRRAAIATLCSRVANAKALLSAMAAGKIPPVDLSADLARQLEYLGDPEISGKLAEVWGQVRESSEEKLAQIAAYKKLVADRSLPPPDAELGRAIFAKTCQRCHVLYGIGEALGPELTGSNRSNLDYLLENIVDPSAVMAKEYRQSVFLTDSGQVVTGIVRSETANAVNVQTAEALVVVPKSEIEQRSESQQSMMPDNQLSQFGEHDIRSLIAYLRGKQQVPVLATPDNASTLLTSHDLAGWHGNAELWSLEDGQIVGRSEGLKSNEFLVSDMSAGDFRLTLDIKLVNNQGNSGIQFRSQTREDGSVEGYQADVGVGWWGKLYEEHGRGLLWDRSGEAHVKSGEWNQYTIEAVGSQIRTWLNGQPCVELDDPEGARRGIFAIQLHSGGPTEVRVRNIKLEPQ